MSYAMKLTHPCDEHAAVLRARTQRVDHSPLLKLVGRIYDLFVTWQKRVDERRYLASMDDWQLADIGIDRVDAIREARKPFWKA